MKYTLNTMVARNLHYGTCVRGVSQPLLWILKLSAKWGFGSGLGAHEPKWYQNIKISCSPCHFSPVLPREVLNKDMGAGSQGALVLGRLGATARGTTNGDITTKNIN